MAVGKSVGQRRFTAPPSLSAHPFPHRQASLMMTGTSKSSTPSLRRSLRPLRRLAHLPRRSSSWRQCRRSPAFSRAARCSAAKATPTVARARPRCGSDGGAPRDAHPPGGVPSSRKGTWPGCVASLQSAGAPLRSARARVRLGMRATDSPPNPPRLAASSIRVRTEEARSGISPLPPEGRRGARPHRRTRSPARARACARRRGRARAQRRHARGRAPAQSPGRAVLLVL